MRPFSAKTIFVEIDAQGLGEIDIRITHRVPLLKINLACAVQHPFSEDLLLVITSEMVVGGTVGIVPLDQGSHVTPVAVDIQYSWIPPANINGNYKFHARKLDAENAPPQIPGSYIFFIEFHAPH